MNTYEFEAIENYPGARIADRFRIEADTFAEACAEAQYNETVDAFQNDREPTMYNEFKQII